MNVDLPSYKGITLQIGDLPSTEKRFATSVLKKGLLLLCDNRNLAEEAVGFGFPVIKRGLQTIFPGTLELSMFQKEPYVKIEALYNLNLEERISGQNSPGLKSVFVYSIKNYLAAMIRHVRILRGPLSALSSLLRWIFGWKTIYEVAPFCTKIKMLYSIEGDTITIETLTEDLSGTGVTEIILMNEQGAHCFERYRDSSGLHLQGKQIGCWDQVAAGEASFESAANGISFTLCQVPGACLFRGRELIGSRLAWSGFGYSYPPQMQYFTYTLKVKRTS